jgi:hypothetical protein
MWKLGDFRKNDGANIPIEMVCFRFTPLPDHCLSVEQTGDDALTIGFIGKEERRYEPEEKAGEVLFLLRLKYKKGLDLKRYPRT